MIKPSLLFFLFLFLIGLASNVSALELVEVNEANDYRLEWYLTKQDITKFEYVVSIQNLKDNKRDFDLALFFKNQYPEGVEVYEWKNITKEIEVKKIVTEEIKRLERQKRGLYKNGSIIYDYNIVSSIETHERIVLENKSYLDWKKTQNPNKEFNNDRISYSYGNINIPKFESKQKGATVNGTKFIKVKTRCKLENNQCNGIIGFTDKSTTIDYHPEFHSGWNFARDLDIIANSSSAIMNETSLNLTIPLNLDDLVTAGKLQADYDDLRLTINGTFTVPIRVDYTAGKDSFQLYFNLSHNILANENYSDLSLHYGNSSASRFSLHNNTQTIDYDFNDDGTLELFYPLDEGVGGGTIAYDNATTFNSAYNLPSVSDDRYITSNCRQGTCWDFNNADSATLKSTAANSNFIATPLTIDMWYSSDQVGTNHFFFGMTSTPGADEILIGDNGANLFIGVNDNNGDACTSLFPGDAAMPTPAQLTHFRFLINSSLGSQVYMNNSLVGIAENDCNLADFDEIQLGGRAEKTNERADGQIDEVYVWTAEKGAPRYLNGALPVVHLGGEESQDAIPPVLFIDQPTNTTLNFLNPDFNFTIEEDNLDVSWYSINDTENITLTTNISLSIGEGNYIVKLFANDTNGNGENQTSVSFVIDLIPSVTTPTFNPVNGELINNITNINASTIINSPSGSAVTVDMVLFANGEQIQNISTENIANGTNHTVIFNSDNYIHFDSLIVEAYAVSGSDISTFLNSSASIVVNTDPTTPQLILPASDFTQTNTSLFLTCDVSTDLDNDTLNFEFYSDQANPPITLIQNSTSNETELTALAQGVHYWNCRANDQVGGNSSDTQTRNFTIDVSNIKTALFGWDLNVLETEETTFTANITYNNLLIESITAILTYNSTNFPGVIDNDGNGSKRFNVSLIAPLVAVDQNKTFNWTFTNTYYNTTTFLNLTPSVPLQQKILSTALLNCLGGNSSHEIVAEFPVLTEPNKTAFGFSDMNANATFESIFNLWIDNRTNAKELNIDVTNQSLLRICAFPTGINWSADAEINYFASGYDQRQHYLRQEALNNTNIFNRTLFLIGNADGTPITFEVLDENDEGLQNHYIEVERKDFITSLYDLVAIGKTDSDGKSTISLEQTDAFYRFKIFNYNNLLKTTQDTQIVVTELEIPVTGATQGELRKKFGDIAYTLEFDNSSKMYILSFADPNSEMKQGCLRVVEYAFNSEGVIYDECLPGSSGAINFTIPDNTSSYSASFYASINPTSLIDTVYNNFTTGLAQTIGAEGVVMALLFVMTLALIGSWNPAVAVGFGVLGIIVSALMGILIISLAGIIGLIIVGAFFAYKMRT